jgi:hypothetical protein
MLVFGFFNKAICSSKNYLNLTEALALSFYSYGCNYFTALESGEIRLLLR